MFLLLVMGQELLPALVAALKSDWSRACSLPPARPLQTLPGVLEEE